MSNGPQGTAKEQLEASLTRMMHGSLLKFPPALVDDIRKKSLKNFEEHEAEWDEFGDRVLQAAYKIGSLAEQLARIDSELNGTPVNEIQPHHAHSAIAAVKSICQARFGIKFHWCP